MTNQALTLQHFDQATRPTDDLFTHVNGGWAESAQIPDDRSGWGAFYELRETSERQVREIIERCAVDAAEADPDEAVYSSLAADAAKFRRDRR